MNSNLNNWNNIYSLFDPVAFEVFGFRVHWYGIMYVLALIVALALAKYFVRRDRLPIEDKTLDNYFLWVEIGVVLGARIGYIAIYDDYAGYYFTHPWEIFNPFRDGEFVGIRGMSYHGAVVGFVLATAAFCVKYRQNVWLYLDLVALSVPLGYVFGRVGNFLNQELVGRVTQAPWGILVEGILRHPSQLYEAALEGLGVFVLLWFYRARAKARGELIAIYAVLYTAARFVCEFWREPDANIGFVAFGLSMGQILSLAMMSCGLGLLAYLRARGDSNLK